MIVRFVKQVVDAVSSEQVMRPRSFLSVRSLRCGLLASLPRAFVAEKTFTPSNFDSALAIQQPLISSLHEMIRLCLKSPTRDRRLRPKRPYTVRRKRPLEEVGDGGPPPRSSVSSSWGSVSRICRETRR